MTASQSIFEQRYRRYELGLGRANWPEGTMLARNEVEQDIEKLCDELAQALTHSEEWKRIAKQREETIDRANALMDQGAAKIAELQQKVLDAKDEVAGVLKDCKKAIEDHIATQRLFRSWLDLNAGPRGMPFIPAECFMDRDSKHCPGWIVEAIAGYLETGDIDHDLIEALLCNDLVKAYQHSDLETQLMMGHVINYLWNKVPATAWGSKDKVAAWTAKGGNKGHNAPEKPAQTDPGA